MRSIEDTEKNSIELLALDKGPGISDLSQCLHDGYSTKMSKGIGLGAIARLASVFDIYSLPQKGTTLFARIDDHPTTAYKTRPLEISAICLPKPQEEVSGDGWATDEQENRTLILLADGLGHGPEAAKAAQAAKITFYQNKHLPLLQIITAIDIALRKTRGAAVALAAVHVKKREVYFVGLGNIAAQLCTNNETRHMIGHDGTAGLGCYNIREGVYNLEPNTHLVMHSDGIQTRWRLNQYSALAARHPAVIAGVLYRDFTRGTDDAMVLVATLRKCD